MELRVIAIDGPAGSGKSTVARAVAEALGLDYLDTGAMYRSVTFAVLRSDVDPADTDAVGKLTAGLEISVDNGVVTVDGVDATIEIRGPEVTRAVSTVAANPTVRTELVSRQREWARRRGGGVIEGRDIGSVVFPDALVKVYLTASEDARAGRRAKEVTDLDYETVAADLARRDALDQDRAASPLVEVGDAVAIDTTDREVEAIVAEVLRLVDSADRGYAVTGAGSEVRPGDDARTRYGPLARWEAATYHVVIFLIRLVALAVGRVKIVDGHKVPTTGPFILAPVHRSFVDFALAALVSKQPLRAMAKDEIWKSKLLGRFVSAMGAFPVHRGTADREALRACQQMLDNGEPVLVFPEGTRRSGPVIEDLFDGSAYLAARTGVPIVPVGIGGSERMMPKGSRLPHPTRLVLLVGDPVAPPPPTEKGRVPRSAVRDLTLRLQAELQRLLDEANRMAGPKGRLRS